MQSLTIQIVNDEIIQTIALIEYHNYYFIIVPKSPDNPHVNLLGQADGVLTIGVSPTRKTIPSQIDVLNLPSYRS